jgi:hypothetical protein
LIATAVYVSVSAFASGTGILIGARVVMGLGAAFVMPATLSILNAVFPPTERPQAIAAGLAALAVFTWWELRIAHPLVDLRIFASRAFSTAAASVTVIFFALFGSLFVLTQYLQLVHGYSPLSAGLRALPFALAIGAMSPLSPILASRFGTRVIIPAGMALMGLGLLDLSTAGVHTAAAHSAFVNAMAMGVRVAAGVALVCAVAAIFALPRRREPQATQAAPVTQVTRPATTALLPAA